MTTTLVLPEALESELTSVLGEVHETAAVLLARKINTDTGTRLLARRVIWVDEKAYSERTATAMTIASTGYVDALNAAEADRSTAIWFHTHPGVGATPKPSRRDQVVDEQIADLFRLRTGSEAYGTLIFAPAASGYAFTGTFEHNGAERVEIDRIWSVGDFWRLRHSFSSVLGGIDPIFDRNIRAFGPDIQRVLGDLTVAIVGSGGTGSAVAEQIVRLGVRKIILVDVDQLSDSNVTRVYGSTPGEVGQPKVEVLAAHLKRIAPGLSCKTIAGMVTAERVARDLRGADLIFGCTDDNAGRLVLSRLSTFYLTPVIDVGVLLSSNKDGLLTGIDGRITTMTPGSACLVCRDRVDLARAAAELKTPEERKRLADEGYAPALGQTEPAVIAYTTAVAAAGVNELLDRLIGFGPVERPTETLLRLHEREVSTNCAEPRVRHYCHPSQGKWGAGDETPFLEQLWPA
jgi:molybdopterin/thiamine biosynthesis adenylyltransferase/proteasome lid subunit RPN8/RPN11